MLVDFGLDLFFTSFGRFLPARILVSYVLKSTYYFIVRSLFVLEDLAVN